MEQGPGRYDAIPTYIGNGLLDRHPENPIITVEDIPGGAASVFNSGFALYGDRTVGLIHAWDREWIPRFFVGWSDDGVHFDIEPKNMIVPPDEHPYVPHEGIFDARITEIEGVYYITYNVASALGGRIMLAKTTDFKEIETIGFIAGPDHRNCVIFPERIKGDYVRLERPMGEGNIGDIYISYSPDLTHWGRTKLLLQRYHRYWESYKVGGGAPPVRTDEGWLTVYHSTRLGMNGHIYMAGCMLLDLEDPSRIIGKMNEPILSPEMYYERVGIVNNVTFPTAAVPHGDELWVYYGAADTCVGLAIGSISELVDLCLKSPFDGQKPCR